MSRQLYLVWMKGAEPAGDPDLAQAVKLHEGLWVVASQRTRSRLYHGIKRRFSPESLLVAPLSDAPKFKGMIGGTTRSVRELAGL